ncbi:hypothetical protein ATANTOWER_023861 [Ataeniobius toweri]|uniref:Uncharacterized protein n=1 Tax=Ataeniobius toweri TaxID=208326 RepID=A0ABU7AC18_9TELE|nr:hypothetical protein [Ataeniobius toweri]
MHCASNTDPYAGLTLNEVQLRCGCRKEPKSLKSTCTLTSATVQCGCGYRGRAAQRNISARRTFGRTPQRLLYQEMQREHKSKHMDRCDECSWL